MGRFGHPYIGVSHRRYRYDDLERRIQHDFERFAYDHRKYAMGHHRLGDIFGRKRMFMLGAVIFAIGSFISSISHNVGTLIIGEAIVEGIGAALMLPATSSLLVTNYEGHDRTIAFGVWGAAAGVASAIGPILGGYLTTDFSWRWGFRVNIVVVILLLLGSYLIHEAKDEFKKITLDMGGVVLSALGLLSIVFGIIKASDFGWVTSKEPFHLFKHVINLGKLSPTPLFVVIGFLFLIAFYYYERRIAAQGKLPLIDLDIFKNRLFVAGVVTTGLTTLGMTGIFFTLPVFLEAVRGYTALHTGVALLPLPLLLLVASPLAVYLSTRVQARNMIAFGILVTACAAVWMHFVISVTVGLKELAFPLGLYGFGIGLVLSQISNITLSAVSNDQAGEASGINNTVRQLGSTLGSAIIGAVLISVLLTNLRSGIQSSTILPSASKTGITTAAVAQSSSIEFGNSIQLGSSAPNAIKNEVANIAHSSVTTATRTTLWYTAGFSMIAFLFSFTLPLKKKAAAPAAAGNGMNVTDSPIPATKQAGRMSMDEALAATAMQSDSNQKAQPMVMARETPAIVAPSLATVHKAMAQSASVSAHPAEPKAKDENKSYGSVVVVGILALLIAAAAGLFGGYEWGLHHEKTKVASTSSAQPGPLYSVLAPSSDTSTQSLSDANTSQQQPQVLGSTVTAPLTPAAPTRTTPAPVATTPAKPLNKTYTYNGAYLSITVPTAWTVSQSDQDGTVLKIYDGSAALRGQLFIQAGVNETLDQKRTELEANSQVSNIMNTTFHGIAALSYVQSGIPGMNTVLEYKGSMYTFSLGAQHEIDGYSIRFF
jgi:EmrB/QacA subfamily drug resistance transporter